MKCDVLFRVDGDADIGVGHVVRSIALANVLKKKGYQSAFFSLCPPGVEIIRRAGYDVVSTEGQDGVLASVQRLRPSAVVVDLKDGQCPSESLLRIKDSGPLLILLDDQTERRAVADIVIDPTMGPGMGTLPRSPHTVYCLGPQYAILREEFRGLREKDRTIRDRIEEVFVCFGGGDQNGLTFIALELITRLEGPVRCTVVVGPAFPYYKLLRERTGRAKCLTIFQTPPNVPELMHRADVAIIHFGMLLYEAASLGLPVFLINPTALHDSVSDKFSRVFAQDIAFNLGHYRNVRSDLFREVWASLEDRAARERIALSGLALVDGKGAERVADIIEERWRRQRR